MTDRRTQRRGLPVTGQEKEADVLNIKMEGKHCAHTLIIKPKSTKPKLSITAFNRQITTEFSGACRQQGHA